MAEVARRSRRLLTHLERDVALVAILCVMVATALVTARAPGPIASAATSDDVFVSDSADRYVGGGGPTGGSSFSDVNEAFSVGS